MIEPDFRDQGSHVTKECLRSFQNRGHSEIGAASSDAMKPLCQPKADHRALNGWEQAFHHRADK
jgi:hypothetical protein